MVVSGQVVVQDTVVSVALEGKTLIEDAGVGVTQKVLQILVVMVSAAQLEDTVEDSSVEEL